MSLKFKVFFPLLLLGAAMEGYLAFVWLPDTISEKRQQTIQKIDEHLASLSRTLLHPVLDTDFAAIYGTLDSVLHENPYWRDLYLTNSQGVMLYPLERSEPPAGRDYPQLHRKIDYLGDEVGRLILAVDIEPELAAETYQLKQLVWLALAAIGTFLLATGIVIEFMVRRPTARLALASNQLRAGNFSAPLPKAGNDEVGRLVNSFNGMRQSIRHYQQRLEQQIKERKQAEEIQLGRSRVLERLAAGGTLKEVLTLLATSIEESAPDTRCSVLLVDESGKRLRHGAAPGLPDFYTKAIDGLVISAGAGSCGTSAYTGERVIVEDVLTHPYWAEYRELARRTGFRACWSEPILSANGKILGTFALYYDEPRQPRPSELETIKAGAQLAAIALEHKHTQDALRDSSRKYRTLYDDTPAMFFTLDTEGIMLSVNRFGAEQLQYRVEDLIGRPAARLYTSDNWRTVYKHLNRCLREPDTVQHWELAKIRRDGSEIWVRETARHVRDADGQPSVLVVCEDITETHTLSKQLSHQASHDSLTNLYNRHEFERRLQHALDTAWSEKTEHILWYLDLDQFKVINDTCGHIAGDELLRQTANLVHGQVRKHDTVARLGGDEFGILMEHCSIEAAGRAAHTLRIALEDYRFLWQDKSFSIGVSIGMVPITEASESINSVLSAADTACYAAKDRGRNRIHVFHAQDEELAKRHREMLWVSRIQSALEENRLQLCYQPLMPIGHRPAQGVHYELLLRMLDEHGVVVLPDAFLPAAERYNLSSKLDSWVVSEALRWLTRHPEHLQRLALCSINLSGLSIGDDKFQELVVEQFEKSRVPPRKICFELTETAAIANLTSATRFIKALKKLGCRFALDDFGSGLSSFAYLKNLPVDFLKIDGIFVKDIVDDPIDLAMVRSINEIGHVMGKQTVAEFVENELILYRLRELGVDYVQGYHIGRPQPIEALLHQDAAAAKAARTDQRSPGNNPVSL